MEAVYVQTDSSGRVKLVREQEPNRIEVKIDIHDIYVRVMSAVHLNESYNPRLWLVVREKDRSIAVSCNVLHMEKLC